MRGWTVQILWLFAAAALGPIALTGCGKKSDAIDLHFVFEDARGITVGDRVMGDGVEVGRVIAPPQSPKPQHVVVSVRIDRISPEKRKYLTDQLSAVIRKDSLVAGQTYLELVFPSSPGVPVASGTTLKGLGSNIRIVDPKDPQRLLELIRSIFVAVDSNTAGITAYYMNWISISVAVVTIIALILDFLLRLPQATDRERSSPIILREIWSLFCLILVLRFFAGAFRALGGLGLLGENLLALLGLRSSSLGELLNQEWPFWALVFAIVLIRFRFQLLTRVKTR